MLGTQLCSHGNKGEATRRRSGGGGCRGRGEYNSKYPPKAIVKRRGREIKALSRAQADDCFVESQMLKIVLRKSKKLSNPRLELIHRTSLR